MQCCTAGTRVNVLPYPTRPVVVGGKIYYVDGIGESHSVKQLAADQKAANDAMAT